MYIACFPSSQDFGKGQGGDKMLGEVGDGGVKGEGKKEGHVGVGGGRGKSKEDGTVNKLQ
jgi:hypothetical protein